MITRLKTSLKRLTSITLSIITIATSALAGVAIQEPIQAYADGNVGGEGNTGSGLGSMNSTDTRMCPRFHRQQ